MTDNPALLPSSSDTDARTAAAGTTAMPLSPFKRGLLGAALFILLAVAAIAVWFGWEVPVSDADIQFASWLGDSHPDTFMTGALGIGVSFVLMMLGAGFGVAKNSAYPPVVAMVLTLALGSVQDYSAQLRWGVMTGDARIGCFEWSSRECHEMLKVPVGNAPSMYTPDVRDDLPPHRADWYVARARQFEAQKQAHVLEYLKNPGRLKAVMDAQRAEVARFQASRGVTH